MQKNRRKLKITRRSVAFILFLCFIALLSFTNRPSARYKLDFFTAENQFYVCDSAFTSNTGENSFWTPAAYNDRLAIADDIVGIGIASFGHVKAELNILDAASGEKDFKNYDHVVEAGVRVSSGILQVLNYPDNKFELKAIVTPGRYRIRIYSYGLKNVNPEEDEGADHYKIEFWPDNNTQRKVLKQFVKD